MQNTIKRFFHVDAYKDPVWRTRAGNFYISLFAVLVVTALLTLINFIGTEGAQAAENTLLAAILFAPLFALEIWQTRIGNLRRAVWILVFHTVAFFIYSQILTDTFSLVSGAIFPMTLLIVALSSVERDVIWSSILATGVLLFNLAEHLFVHGDTVVASTNINLVEWSVSWLTVLWFFAGISWLIAHSLPFISEAVRASAASRQLILTQTSASVAQNILTRLDIESLLNETVEQLRTQFEDIYHAQVFLLDASGKSAVLRASSGEVGQMLLKRGHSLSVGSQSVIGRATLTGKAVLAEDTTADPIHKSNELLPNTHTELALPLRSREGIIGALDVQSTRSHAFAEEDINVLQALADQIAIALDNARLLTEAQNEAARAKALSEASYITSRINVDFGRGLNELFETVTGTGDYTHWWVGTLDNGGQKLHRLSAHTSAGTNILLPDDIDLSEDKNALTEAVKNKKPIMVNHFDDHPLLGTIPAETRIMFGKHLATPIMDSSGDHVVGALLVGRADGASNLAESDLDLISSLTNQVSIAFENRRLFERVATEQQMLTSVVNAMPTGVVVVEASGLISIVNEQARRLLGTRIESGTSIIEAYTFQRSGSQEPYPLEELPVWLALKQGKPSSAEDVMIQHSNGTHIDLIARAAPIRNSDGKVIAAVSTYQDITELRELERALQDSLSETTKLYEASRVVSRASDLGSLGKAVVGQMMTMAPGGVYLLVKRTQPDGSETIEVAVSQRSTQQELPDITEVLPASVLMPSSSDSIMTTANLTFATRDLATIPGINKTDADQLRELGIHALTILPLEIRNQVFGSIVGVFTKAHDFAPDERRFLITLADQTAVALDAVLSFEQTQAALQATAQLYRTSRAIAEVQEVDAALEVVTQEVQSLHPDRIDVFLMRNQEEFEQPFHAATWARDEVTGISPALPVYSEVDFDLLSITEYFIEDIQAEATDNAFASALVASNSPYASIASVVFRAAGQPTGRLTLGYLNKHHFSNGEKQFLRMLADTTAYIIENDILFKQTQDSLEETGILYQAIRAFANAHTNEGIIQAIIDYAADPIVDKAMLCMLITDTWQQEGAMMEVAVSWVRGESVALEGMRFTAEQFPSWQQISSSEIVWVDDVMEDPSLDDTAKMGYRALDFRSFAIIPLQAGGNPIGAILLGASTARTHSDREIRIYQSLADQAAITLENNRLYEQAEHRIRQLATSSRVSQAANSILRLEELLPEMVDLIQSAFNYDHVQIFLVDGRRENAELKASTGETGQQLLDIRHSLPVGSRSVIGQVTSLGKPFIALDTADAEVMHKPNLYLPNTRSEMAVPLLVKGEIVGALDVQSNRPGAFTDEDVRILSSLADQLAVAIENARLFELSQQSLEESQMLYQTIRALSNVESVEQMMQAIVEHGLAQGVDKALLCLLLTETWESDNAIMEVRVSWVSSGSLDLTGMRFTAEQFPSWEQLSTSTLLWVDDVMEHPNLDEIAKMGYLALDIQAFTIVPLQIGGKSIGAILLGSSEPRQHTEPEIRVYQSIADQAAITLENYQLYEQSQRRARQLATSAQVSQAANSILQIDELMPQVVELIRDSFGYNHVQIFLVDQDEAIAYLRASTGEAGQQLLAVNHSLPVGSRSVIGHVTATGEPSIALDTADARVIHKPNPYLPNTRSEMAVPLLSKGQVIGALDIQSNQPGAFNEGDVQILSVLADQVAVAIDNARLFEQSQQRSAEMSFLFAVTSEATAFRDLTEMLERVSSLLRSQLEANAVVSYLYDPRDHVFTPASIAVEMEQDASHDLPVIDLGENHPLARAARNRTSLIVRNLKQEGALFAKTRSSVYTPLLAGEELVGVIAVESNMSGAFTPETLGLLQALTGSLAAVIQSVRLLIDLQEANERLREIDQLKTNFLAAMSHELRTPLNSIIGFSRVILKEIDGPITDMQRQDLQTIHDSGKHLLGLVNDILDQAKIEAGKMELAREHFDLKAVVKGVMDSAKGLTKEKPISLVTEIETDLPDAFGDEFRTRQILFNLVSNAAKFTQEGSITTSAHLVEEDGRTMIQVSVTDTGIGIDSKDFHKLFESFQQVDNTTTRAAEGTGLGLPLAKSLAELQGGRIWVESEVGFGSTFSITIPVEPLPEDETEAASTEELAGQNGHESAPKIPAPPKMIMVVEGDVDMINLYRRYLSKDGWVVIGVSRLDEVENTFMTHNLSAAILDVNMDEGKGWDVLEMLTGRFPVLVSSMNDDFERSGAAGAAGHLVKPFVQDELLEVLGQITTEVPKP